MSSLEIAKTSKVPKTARGIRTRNKILEAAEETFGEAGFHTTSIGDITRRASVALGTFYVYFESKEEIFYALVAHMSATVKTWISERITGANSRLEAEHLGLVAYIDFARANPNLYKIIEEAQFVAPDAYRAHYEGFAESYERNLEESAARGEIKTGNQKTRAWALIGISVFLGLKFGIWDKSRSSADIAREASDLISFGLRPE